MFSIGFLKQSNYSHIVATGGTITTNGNYKVHTFTSSGTFQITSGNGFVRTLVVAGGGSGGSQGAGGGGGAGGMIDSNSFNIPVSFGSSATVIIGAGGSSAGATGVNGLILHLAQ
jgi:hypothetical protein